MSDEPDPREQQIAALEEALRLPLPEATLAQLAQDLRALRESVRPMVASPHAERDVNIATQQTVQSTAGTVSNDGRIDGVAVGVNLGTIIYGRRPEEDARRRLVWYLDRLANKLSHLPLRGLDERLDQGKGIALPQVYVMLATTNRIEVARDGIVIQHPVEHFYTNRDRNQPLNPAYDPDYALPHHALVTVEPITYRDRYRRDRPTAGHVLYRALLATEAFKQRRYLVLLGEPGSGKSTFLRHLAWALARRSLDQQGDATLLVGWDNERQWLPIVLPLRTLAGRLATQGVNNATIYTTLRDEIQSYNIGQVDDMLSESLHRGAVQLLFDGLDEVPLDAIPGVSLDRRSTLRAVRDFAQLHASAAITITCRTRALDEQLRAELGWPLEIIAPFTLGQIRHFIPAWYRELAQIGQIELAQADRLARQLLDTIVTSPKLRTLAENPLLLTMMALVLYNRGELPRDRPQLYERILELLLGQWDKVRDGQSLAEAIGQPDWGSERIRPLLDRLSFEAHGSATSADGRGRLARRAMRDALERYLVQAGMRDDQAAAAAVRCLDYFNQRSGLLVPDDAQDSYVFAHLTLQEHCAGRALALDLDAASLIMGRRADDRWHEPIFLGLGAVQQTNPALIDRVLSDLIDPDEDGRPKPVEHYQRDLILAAEIGQDRDWGYLRSQRVNVDRLQRDLRRGLVELLCDKAQSLPVAERVRAGFLLGDLGDPRVPITTDEWRREVARTQRGDPGGYFCPVAAGSYHIGSRGDDPDADAAEQPQHTVTFDAPFWIARYPITNDQWRAWVQAGGRPSYFADDSDLNRPNQPATGVSWHMCNDFCAWLSAQLGVTVRLPTEPEWEAAARGGNARRYPWGDEWMEDHAATEEDQETRGARYSVPVGCYPAGATPCGVLDMAGNVWEWTASEWRSYPEAKKPFTEDEYRVVRGGHYDSSRKRVRCGVRGWGIPVFDDFGNGFRVVVALRLAQIF